MKMVKRFLICGIAVVLVLGVCLVVLLSLRSVSQKEETVEESVDYNEEAVELQLESAAVEILEADDQSVDRREGLSAGTVSEDKGSVVSDDRASELPEKETEDTEATVSGNGLQEEAQIELATAGQEEVPTEENPAEKAEEKPEEIVDEAAEEVLPADQKAPFFLVFNGSPVIKTGDVFDVHKYIGYADDVDRQVELELSGEVNTAAEGSYPLTITLRDDAGHVTTQNMNVKVSPETGGGGGYVGQTEAFSDFIAKYKTEETSVGIDISRWQETVDFEKVKAAGCEFVYMRIGGLDDGELYTDRYYLNNIAGAKAAGLKVGIYWHAEESTPEEVRASVDYLMGVLNGETLDFPIAYDWEDFLHFENYGMSIYDLNRNLRIFGEEIKARGYSACLYNSKYYLDTIWTNESGLPVWLAHYVSSTSYQGHFMWQHGCTGRIDGINGDVDLDVLYHNAVY